VTTGITYGEFSVLYFLRWLATQYCMTLERENWLACWLLCKFWYWIYSHFKAGSSTLLKELYFSHWSSISTILLICSNCFTLNEPYEPLVPTSLYQVDISLLWSCGCGMYFILSPRFHHVDPKKKFGHVSSCHLQHILLHITLLYQNTPWFRVICNLR
jgi:hypothetical protein